MLVKVWNDNVHPYSEKFRGLMIQLPPKSYIEMDEDEAESFKSTFTFPKLDGQDMPDPKFFKMIRVEREAPKPLPPADPLMNHATGKKADSLAELVKYALENSDRLAKDPEAEEFSKALKKENKELKKDNKELKARIDMIMEHLGLTKGEADGESLPV